MAYVDDFTRRFTARRNTYTPYGRVSTPRRGGQKTSTGLKLSGNADDEPLDPAESGRSENPARD